MCNKIINVVGKQNKVTEIVSKIKKLKVNQGWPIKQGYTSMISAINAYDDKKFFRTQKIDSILYVVRIK